MIEYTVKVHDSGNKYWFLNGARHREDGPAIEYANGSKEWYKNGKRLIVIDGKEIKISEESFNELKKSLN